MSDATEPDCQPSACKRLCIDSLINMPVKTAPSLDDLANHDEAFHVLLGMASKLLERAIDKQDLTLAPVAPSPSCDIARYDSRA
jgi:hypothetical protein